MFERNFSLSATSSVMTLPEAITTAYMWAGKVRRGDDGRVARPHQRQAHVAEAFLRADA